MVRIVYRVVIKDGCLRQFKLLANEVLVPEARKLVSCKLFSLFQSTSNKHEFVFVEEWLDHESVAMYKRKLIELLGPANAGEEFPKKLNDLIQEDEDIV